MVKFLEDMASVSMQRHLYPYCYQLPTAWATQISEFWSLFPCSALPVNTIGVQVAQCVFRLEGVYCLRQLW